MPDIRYVILSDLHFGAENSILTCLKPEGIEPDPHQPSVVMKSLVECLAELATKNEGGDKPQLVLCGDILELALATDNVAAMVFERFVEQIFPSSGALFDRTIYFVPGNHDHHLWETARERQYAEYLRQPDHGPGTDLGIPWHTTRMFLTPEHEEAVQAELLTTLIRRYPHLSDVTVLAVYPNLRLTVGDRTVVVHHGHFVEGMYRLMSTLKDMVFPGRPPADKVWQWEAENFAWIDFFWSTLGRSGQVGTDVGLVYASLQSEPAMRQLARNLAWGIADKRGRPQPWRWIEEKALGFGLGKLVQRIGGLERVQPTDALSERAEKGLYAYLGGPLLSQLHEEIGHGKGDLADLPKDLTFVFGHTHKPFERALARIPEGYRGAVSLYNTGGWVVDSERSAPLQGGAAILLDEDLNAVSLRVYNQEDYRPRLTQVQQGAHNPLLERLSSLLDADAGPWTALAAATHSLVDERHADLAKLISRGPVPYSQPRVGRLRSSRP